MEPGNNAKENIMELIYNEINNLFGKGNQLFTMCYPAQPLNMRMYQYAADSNTSVMTKPYSVAENEFRLSDQLFDVSPVTAGPNGDRLSVVYDTLINNFIPKLDYLVPFIRDRAGLASFLEEDSDELDDNERPLSRIELCKILYNNYLEKKNAWNEEKNKKFDALRDEYQKALADFEKAKYAKPPAPAEEVARLERIANDKENWRDEYAKWFSSYGMVQQEQLNNYYNDVVVRGHLHEVMTILGYLNASSTAEELEVTKQRMRNSARSSLDESMTVYPVQFQPNNWFKALAPNLNPTDLTMAADSIQDILMAKQRELSRARAELAQMDLLDVTPEEIKAAQDKMNTARNELQAKERELESSYGDAIVGIAKAVIAMTPAGEMTELAKDAAKLATKAKKINPDIVVDKLGEAVNGVIGTKSKQDSLNSAAMTYQKLATQRAQLDSRDWKFNKAALQERVRELNVEVDYYTNLFAGVTRVKDTDVSKEDYEKLRTAAATLLDNAKTANNLLGNDKLNVINDISPNAKDNPNEQELQAALQALNRYLRDDLLKTADTIEAKMKTYIAGLDPKDTNRKPANGAYKALQEARKGLDTTEEAKQSPSLLSATRTEAEAEIAGMFQDIVIKHSTREESAKIAEKSAASSSKWAVSLWFASAGGQSSASSAESSEESEFFQQDIEIGFRAAKVTFDRGGWFNPALFKLSNAFYHLAPMKAAGGLTVDDVKKCGKPSGWDTETAKKFEWLDDHNHKEPYVLPAFPVAMAIAKDVTIKVRTASGSSFSSKSVVENAASSGGGFLCFSASSASSNRSMAESTFHGDSADGYYIHIPGPQVIGYFQQFVPMDNSEPYRSLQADDGGSKRSEVLDAFELYKSKVAQVKKVQAELPAPAQETAALNKTHEPV